MTLFALIITSVKFHLKLLMAKCLLYMISSNELYNTTYTPCLNHMLDSFVYVAQKPSSRVVDTLYHAWWIPSITRGGYPPSRVVDTLHHAWWIPSITRGGYPCSESLIV